MAGTAKAESYMQVAARVFPTVIDAVKARMTEAGKAEETPSPDVMVMMAKMIVEEFEKCEAEFQTIGMDTATFLAFPKQHKEDIEAYMVSHPEQRERLAQWLNPF
eukprot:m51a1_g14067 hypothetical protein (105) ;mRNA; r:1234418-1234898